LDIIIIVSSLIFVLLDLKLDEGSHLKTLLNIRGLFRLFRVFILIRKLNAVRIRREMRKKVTITNDYDFRSPFEKVLEILNEIRD
jgi:amino acid permease